jgi:hypothetical protein
LTLIAFSDISLRTHKRVTYVDILIIYVLICTSYVLHEHICAHLPCTQTVHHRAITRAHGLVVWQHANRPSYMTCVTSHLSMPKGENASNDSSTTRFRGSAAKATSPSTYLFQAGEPMTPCREHGGLSLAGHTIATPQRAQAAVVANRCGPAATWLPTLGRQTGAEAAA